MLLLLLSSALTTEELHKITLCYQKDPKVYQISQKIGIELIEPLNAHHGKHLSAL